MITVTYDPHYNLAVPDGSVIMVAEGMTEMEHARDPAYNIHITICTGLIIDALRVLVKTGRFPADQLKFKYRGLTINVDDKGRCLPWPAGFNDTMESLLMQL